MEDINKNILVKSAPIQKIELLNQPYTCPKCPLSPQLLSVNKISGKIKINCLNHGEQEIHISKAIQELTKNNNFNAICNICQKKNNNLDLSLKYCLECNKIFCKNCLNKHEKHEKNNTMLIIGDVNCKCNLHSEDFCCFCYQCNKSICHICIANKEHLFHKKDFLNEIISKDINQKYIFSINKIFKKEKERLLKKVEELDNLIRLNELLMNSYKNYPKDYNFIKNIDNLLNKNILKEYKDDVLKKKSSDKFNKSNDIYLLDNNKSINLRIDLYDKIFDKFCQSKN